MLDNSLERERVGSYRAYLRQQPVMLVLLFVLAVFCFAAVAVLSKAYHAQREAIGDRWFQRGVADLSAKRYDAAVTDFRAALLYSRDNYDYQLNLAEALIGQKRIGEASAYLLNLWDREPDDGLVNLELARIAAQKGQVQQAIRYYHDAVYAAWPEDQETNRREARLELIELLLQKNQRAQAESEVIALAANAGDEPRLLARLGDLFVRTLDYERAFSAYRLSLKSDRHNPATLAGAGLAAFELGLYQVADKYLEAAIKANPSDAASAERLKTAELILKMNPFQRQLSTEQRNEIVVNDFAVAGERLNACSTASGGDSQAALVERYSKLKPRITKTGLRRSPDLAETAMDLVFDIERQTGAACGPPNEADQALSLIANLHEGNQ